MPDWHRGGERWQGAMPMCAYPALLAHAQRVRARPAFQRTLARELAAVKPEQLAVKPAML